MKKNYILLIFLFFILISACRKYDENTGFSFRSSRGKIESKWKLSSLLFDGIDQGVPNKILTINPDGTFRSELSSQYESGKWSLTKTKTAVYFTFNNSGWTYKYYIIKLTNDEFWYETGEGYLYKYTRE